MEPYKIILVDDHSLFRNGLRGLLERCAACRVVGEAASGEEFLAMLGGVDADVVFMDFAMPGLDGAQTTERALAQRPDLKIITLSMFGEESYYSRMVEAGARGFLLKDSDIGDVIEAVETVAAGGSYFSPQLLSSLTGRMRTREDAADEQLSSREREILVPEIKNPKKYAGQRVVIGSVTDGYNPQEEQFGNTRKLLEQLIGSDADILICTKSDLVVRDIDLLKKLGRVTVSWSINTLDENFKNDMDSASSIEHRIAAMKQVYEAGIRTVCFVSPIFPGITDFEAIFERVKDQCDLFWLENLNLRGGFKKTIMDYIAGKYPDLVPLYDEIYNKHNRNYFEVLEVKAEKMAKKYDCAFVDNEMPYGRVPQGHPVIVDYFYHEEIRGTENTGKRNL